MEPLPIWAAVMVLLFSGASFFFALAETALFSLGKFQAKQLAGQNPRMAAIFRQLSLRPQDLLSALVLGNTFATAALLAVTLWMVLQGHWPAGFTLGWLLIYVLVACEALPKTLAVRDPERWSLRIAGLLLAFEIIARPFYLLAQKMNEAILRLVVPPSVKPQNALNDADYQELLDLAAQSGTLGQAERGIILKIISLDRRAARDVMQPRARMACVSDELSITEMIAAARKYKHRRLPMYDETPDTIVGILNTRTLLVNSEVDIAGVDLVDVLEFPSFVPESMNLLQLFKSLQRQQRGMAIVLDEFGGTAGLVTMEDILGELMGQLHGESAAEGLVIEKLEPGRWRVNGAVRLEDFRREYPQLGVVPEVETMGGLLMHELGVAPASGESTIFRGLKLTARVADERRVRELLVEQIKPAWLQTS
jgi:CBS domain containing-hemolysin-like protein